MKYNIPPKHTEGTYVYCKACNNWELCTCELHYCINSCECNRKKVISGTGRMEWRDYARYG